MNVPGEHGLGTPVPEGQYDPIGHTLPENKNINVMHQITFTMIHILSPSTIKSMYDNHPES